jgi:hypothetical protein
VAAPRLLRIGIMPLWAERIERFVKSFAASAPELRKAVASGR